MINDMLIYYKENVGNYWSAVITHLSISMQVVIISIAIGVPLGIICAKNKSASKFISSSVNILRVIPSLALMVLMIPLMGIGKIPAITALTIIAIPPIMINTAAGFLGIDALILETSKGMGMSPIQSFLKVEMVLAFPLVITGIRTSAVETVASTSIAAYIGAGGLGNMVFTGIGVNRTDILLLGAISIAIISIATELILSIVQSFVGRYNI
jgi:osmoprotectant transport system permease protein